MNFTTWFSFFCAGCLIAISPGSGAILSMSHGLAFGVKKTSATIFGLQLGLLLVLVVAGAGVGSLLLASEIAFSAVKIAGALYLLYLGTSQLMRKAIEAPESQSASALAQVETMPLSRRILTGFLTNASNPKGIVFMVAVLPSFINPQSAVLPQLMILAVTMVFIDASVMHTYAFLAASLQTKLRSARSQKIQNRIFGSVLILIGTSLFFVKRETALST